mmetsp:Transcript_25526/g.71378  ORF Transcript_25526/g.71378 Transcript_25526/m.71378 type:complete len:310 (-) Transcript_25526:254-1183(-)
MGSSSSSAFRWLSGPSSTTCALQQGVSVRCSTAEATGPSTAPPTPRSSGRGCCCNPGNPIEQRINPSRPLIRQHLACRLAGCAWHSSSSVARGQCGSSRARGRRCLWWSSSRWQAISRPCYSASSFPPLWRCSPAAAALWAWAPSLRSGRPARRGLPPCRPPLPPSPAAALPAAPTVGRYYPRPARPAPPPRLPSTIRPHAQTGPGGALAGNGPWAMATPPAPGLPPCRGSGRLSSPPRTLPGEEGAPSSPRPGLPPTSGAPAWPPCACWCCPPASSWWHCCRPAYSGSSWGSRTAASKGRPGLGFPGT